MAGSPAAASRRILTTRLLNGTLTVHGEGHMSSIEYRLGNKFAGRYISSTAAQRCLQQKLVAFVGDSRIRFLYAAFISLLANHNSSRLTSQPRHTLCPLDNQPETHVGACAAFYNPGPRLFRFQAGSTHVVYGESHHGVEQEAIVASRAHVVLADVGACMAVLRQPRGRARHRWNGVAAHTVLRCPAQTIGSWRRTHCRWLSVVLCQRAAAAPSGDAGGAAATPRGKRMASVRARAPDKQASVGWSSLRPCLVRPSPTREESYKARKCQVGSV